MSKLRISAHKLQIEIGRYQGTLRENRICCRCTSGQAEDEIHYLLHCTCHANHREIFTTYLTSECQNFQNLDDKCKLIWILNNEDPTILRYLCQYLLSTTIWLNGIGDLQTGLPALSIRKKIFFLASFLDARCWLSKSSDPFPCSKQYCMCVSPLSFHIKILLYQHGRSALDTSRTLFLLASTQGVSCRLVMNHLIYVYVLSHPPPSYICE